MQKLSVAFALLFANVALGLNIPRAGTQFITGVCTSDKDCASGCCGFRTGKCAGPVIAQERDGGCGFGNAQSNDDAAVALGFAHRPPVSTSPFKPGAQNNGAAPPPPPSTPAAGVGKGSGKALGTQFITGVCAADNECQSKCCGFKTGKCAGAIVAQERDGGCGFGDAQPNDTAARELGFKGPSPAQNNGGAAAPAPTSPAKGSGKAPGTQFITGACANDGECASKCCGFKTGKCAGAIVAQERDGGCGFGDAQPNDTAARELGFKGPSPAQNNNGGAAAPPASKPPTGGSGKPPGTQFITGACANDGECASKCCGFRTGKCAGPIVAQERDGGCGFGDGKPNDRAAKALRGRADPERYVL